MSARETLALGRGEEIARLHELPSPRGVALELMRLAHKDDVAIAQLARLAQADPALAGRLIRAANSPALGVRRPTASLTEAMLRLGVSAVRQLAVAFSLLEHYASGPCGAFDYRRFWTESLLRALAGQTLAARLRLAAPEEAFTCGLLAQVGRLGLATAYPAQYAEVLRAAPDEDDALRAAERARLALDHVALTVSMLQSWGMPPPLLQAIEAHFAPPAARLEEGSRLERLARLLELAQQVARAGACAPQAKRACSRSALLAAARLGVDAEALEALAGEVAHHAKEWAPLFGLAAPLAPLLALAGSGDEPAGVPPAPAPAPPVLLVHSGDAASSVRQALAAEGLAAAQVRSGREALQHCAQSLPELVIADCRHTEPSAAEFARALRAGAGPRPLYLLLLADSRTEEQALAAVAEGADDFLCAPFDARLLRGRLRTALRALRREQELARDNEAIRRLATELALNNRRLHQAALTDPLTGLPNRRYALARLEQECAAARRRGAALACLAVDLDHFKRVNDEHGHEAGDAVLARVAQAMRAAVRLHDCVCRLGGEEFLVILPDASPGDARVLAERLRRAVEELIHRTDAGAALALSVSVGVAAQESGGCAPQALLRRADEALLHAKRAGRNCISEG